MEITTFIALVNVIKYHYCADSSERQEIHLVEAENERSAVDKLRAYYKSIEEEYSHSYSIDVISINEIIR